MSEQKKISLSVDRIEGGYAVCLDEKGLRQDIPVRECDNIREGDIISMDENGIYIKNASKTRTKRAEIISKQQELWE